MTLLGVVGFLIGLLAWPLILRGRGQRQFFLFLLLYLVHIGATVAYYLYSLNNIADSSGYYYDYYNFGAYGFGTATQLVYFIVQGLKGPTGGTLLDFFLLFQPFGFFG